MYAPTGANDQKAFKVHILKATLFLRQLTINPDVLLAHERALSNMHNTKYPIKNVKMTVYNIGQGTTVVSRTISQGTLPTRIVFGMVTATALSGSYATNPFNFQHFNLATVGLTVNGEAVPFQNIDLDFASGNTIQGFNTLFTGIDKLYDGNFIDRSDYNQGYTLFAYDLSPDLCSGNHFDLVGTGSLMLNLRFSTALASSINVVVYHEFQNMIEIDQNRAIITKLAN
jgi:hypothetical protein